MKQVWILILIFSASGLSSSNTTTFLISAPGMLRAGAPTPLAVTLFSDFSASVTAEVMHGNTKVALTQNFQGGSTSVVFLPPLPGSIPDNSLLKLNVWGYKDNQIIFANTTDITFSHRNVSSFIQTDRSSYRPGSTIKIRVVSIQLDNRPYRGKLNISLQDPSGETAAKWESTGNLGIFVQQFALPPKCPLGKWMITTAENDATDKKAFTVEEPVAEAPRFEVLVKTSPWVLAGDDISGSVRALYRNGQPVQGTLEVNLTYNIATSSPPSFSQVKQTKKIYGSAQFIFSKDQLQGLQSMAGSRDSVVVHISARVHDPSTGYEVNKSAEVHITHSPYQLQFLHFSQPLKPSLDFSARLQISRYDKRPLGLEELLNSAVVEVTQTDSSRNGKNTTLMLPVAENGTAKVQFKLQEHIAALFITAKFRSSQQSLTLYNNYSSPSGSYVQISHDSATPAQIGSPLQLDVESTFKLGSLQYVVSSKGQVVAAGTKNSSSFSLTPDLSWSPQACITVYCLLSDGELISDSVFIPIQKHNLVTLNWSKEKAQPGQQVSLTVAAAESKVQVGIVVMGADSSMLQSAPDFKLEQIYNLKTMTNVRVNKNMLPRNENDLCNNDLTVEKHWRYWMDGTDSVAWFDTFVSDKSWTSEKFTVPDGVTFLGAVVLVMSENLGLGFSPVPQKLTVSKDFSLSLVAPPHIIRGEEIVLEANIFNYLEHNLEVIVLLAQSEAFKFVLSNQRDMSVINAKQLTIGSHASASALFPIEPLVLGEMEISVEAVSMEASDSVVWKLLVKPEGIEQSSSQTLFLELAPQSDSYSRSISFSFPPHVVPGSQMARVALGVEVLQEMVRSSVNQPHMKVDVMEDPDSDILALSINNLDSLVQVPIGCGEQNMIHLAPSLYVLQYLDKSGQDDAEIRSRALGYLTKGYQTQLSYQRDDGSFSAFGESDASGSTWLTAFVLRCFLQAQTYIQVDQEVLIQALMWLLKHQGQQGEFLEVGRLIHTEMQGGMDDSSVALTAFVLVAFLEDDSYKEKYASKVSLALNYLENKLSSGVVSNYSLSLVAYALARGNRPLASRALTELKNRADNIGGVMMWTSSAGLNSHDLSRVQSAQIEMAAYVLLALFVRGSFIEGIELMKWLSIQTNHLGGFGTTQDTVIALQALAYYAAFSGANAINLKIDMSSSTSSFKMSFNINSTNYRMCQNQKINAEKDLPLNMYIQGQGFALVQLNAFYNVENQTFLQSPQQASDEEAFSLNIHLAEASNHSNMILTICTRLKDNQIIPNTGMVIVDVGMLSGLGLLPEATFPSDLVRKVESTPEKVHLYLDSLNKTEVCMRLPIIRNYKVARVRDAMVLVYDYYEPTRRAKRTYNSESLYTRESCSFCGENCNLCQSGIHISMSNSQAADDRTFRLSFLFLEAALVSLFAV